MLLDSNVADDLDWAGLIVLNVKLFVVLLKHSIVGMFR
jgi:hypothetical protein